MDYASMPLTEVARLPGVSDLQPLQCRASFAKALKLEAEGKQKEAEEMLDKAIQVEKV